jgi:2-succinyl-5-enolpyruvyl-6-hydroxy-3-cyclohexene-1-carboxylate synthase
MPDQLSHAEVLGRYCGTFVDELVAAGVENVCLCPGSRSTPLALTFARHPQIKLWVHLDERSCAYFALGLSSISSPVAILCSSGTAAANFAPAVIEAVHSHRPLIVLTADRPQELRDLGANQTIDQVRLYGTATKWFVEMPLPEASEQMLRYVRMTARRAVMTSRDFTAGPVHLNFPFREPLLPDAYEPRLRSSSKSPPSEVESPLAGTATQAPAKLYTDTLADRFLRAARPLVVCGPDTFTRLDVTKHLLTSGVPVLADALSGLRCSPFLNGIIGGYDAFLRSAPLAASLKPDLVVRFGSPPTSKPLATYLQRHSDIEQAVIAMPGTWPDPDLTASQVIHSIDSGELAPLLGRELQPDPAWSDAWRRAEAHSLAAIARTTASTLEPTEPSAVLDLADLVPEDYTVFAGNSMPVRDVDSFWPAGPKLRFFEGSRGASGIDGVVSTALGVAARTYGQLALVIGDLSFYHDMNGLLAAQRFGLSATIVLINNDGGGIFSFLPQHDDAEHFETLFGTPHGLDFSHVAGLYGVDFQRVTTREEYRDALKASFDAPGVQIIEIKTDREENLRLHQRIWDEVAKAVEPLVTGEEPTP